MILPRYPHPPAVNRSHFQIVLNPIGGNLEFKFLHHQRHHFVAERVDL